ncbi:hypothetical protein [Pseudobacillus badius]|uniref:hypothetical protein n=1 Tax=Bacillus badius TaxID=1455 RepID=UPI0007B3F498|nr:hypothetical protein [Bacillus badius]KZR56972.1 hypothetical protein A3781_04670 [Bacillus badius]
MSKSTVSLIKIWKSKRGDYFNVSINELGIMIAVHKSKQPKSYEKIESWLKGDEKSFITPTLGEQDEEG